jgi:hypothetical protein
LFVKRPGLREKSTQFAAAGSLGNMVKAAAVPIVRMLRHTTRFIIGFIS